MTTAKIDVDGVFRISLSIPQAALDEAEGTA
jgi:hypothetical protein